MSTSDKHRKRGGLRALLSGLRAALQWRLLLLWALALLLPTAIVALPVWDALGAQFDHSLLAARLDGSFDFLVFTQVAGIIGDSGAWFGGVGTGATVLALLLSPWLSGMVVASIRAGQRLGFAELVAGGVREYGRMLRCLLLALLPMGAALFLAGGAIAFAEKQHTDAILQADVDSARSIALVVAAIVLLLAHLTVEAGRAVLAAEPARKSVVRAWLRGLMLLLHRPLAVLLVYLGAAVLGYGLALGLGVLRLNASAAGMGGFLLGMLLTQLIVAAIAWGRSARLYGLADLARDAAQRREAARLARRPEPQPPADERDDVVAPDLATVR